MHYFTDVIKKYFVFSGRASRREFWMFELSIFVIMLVIFALTMFVLPLVNEPNTRDLGMNLLWVLIGIHMVFSLAVFIPSLAVLVRRLHDISKSGWWYFISLIPLAGGIWLLVLLSTKGDIGSNEYGADPYAVTSPAPVAPNGIINPTPTENVTEIPTVSTIESDTNI
jgi:uncharacterized membrane protein YhaH (DUF805 family)